MTLDTLAFRSEAASFLEVTTTSLARLDAVGRALLFTDARTANSFADTPVTDEELADIWELAKWPPTAANTQPLRVLYVRTEQGKQRLLPLMSEGNRAKTATAPAVAVLAVDTSFHEHIPEIFPIRPQMKDMFEADPGMRDGFGKLSASLQAGYFLLAVRASGLVAGPMGGFDAAGIDREFFPGDRFKSILVVNIGHPGENPWYDRMPRLPHETTIQWA